MSEQPAEPPDAAPEPTPTAEAQAEPRSDEPDHDAGAADKDADGQEETEDDAPASAEAVAVEARLRRQMRRAGMESLGGSWFDGPSSFGGHAAGRDVNVFYGYTSTRLLAPETGQVDSEQLHRISLVHMPGINHAKAARKLDKERLVVLRGTDGSGRRTTALSMLKKLKGDNIHSISAEQILRTHDGSGLTESAGHLADIPATGELAYSRFVALSAALKRLDSYLIITAPIETVTEADVEEQFVVEHEPPGGREVILSHLRLDAGHASAAEHLLRESSVLACATTPGAAAKLAAHLLDAARKGQRPDDLRPVLAEMRRRRARYLLRIGSLKQYRERVELLYRRATLLSIAVFAGLPYADAVLAAEDLAERFITIEIGWDKRYELFIPWRARTGIREDRPDEVLGQLRRIALRDSGRSQTMSNNVRQSVAELFSGPHPRAVVNALGNWAVDRDPRLRLLARRCILPLAHVIDESGDPLLLRIMAGDPVALKGTATAFGAALSVFHPGCGESVTVW